MLKNVAPDWSDYYASPNLKFGALRSRSETDLSQRCHQVLLDSKRKAPISIGFCLNPDDYVVTSEK